MGVLLNGEEAEVQKAPAPVAVPAVAPAYGTPPWAPQPVPLAPQAAAKPRSAQELLDNLNRTPIRQPAPYMGQTPYGLPLGVSPQPQYTAPVAYQPPQYQASPYQNPSSMF